MDGQNDGGATGRKAPGLARGRAGAREARVARRRVPRRTRAERGEDTLRALLDAAAQVIGEVGYADASVARITARAQVAQGTFYNYFASRQDLFDRLLPQLGASMLDYIDARIDRDARGAEREVQRLRAYFAYLDAHPEFYRILYEAETLAPAAHAKHMETIAGGFVRALRRARARGEMPEVYDDRDLEPVALILLAARGYLSMRYGAGRVPDWVVDAYGKLIRHGVLREARAEPDRGQVNGTGDPADEQRD